MKLKTVNIKDIHMGDRFREDLGDIDGMVESFKSHGIIQPLAVKEIHWSPDEGLEPAHRYTLLAGGRRLSAAKVSKIRDIPVRIYERDLNELEMRSIELAENIYRKDLEWQEEVKLKEKIWKLQKELYGEKTTKNPDDPGTSKRKVAHMVGDSPSLFVEDLSLAQVMDKVPQLKDCKTKTDAKKLFNKLKEQVIKKELAKKVIQDRERLGDKLKNAIHDSYIIGDFFPMVKKVKAETIDIIEIDPPYGIDLKKIKKEKGAKIGTKDYNEVHDKLYPQFIADVCKESYRVLKPNGWLIMWFGPDPWFDTMYKTIQNVGFQGNALPGIWLKENMSGQTMHPDIYLGNAYEMFFYARKGHPKLNKPGRSNVFTFRPVPPTNKVHPTERPIEMIQEVLSTFGHEGMTVMSPFLGSGNTLLASVNNKMQAFGYDLSREYKTEFTLRVNVGKVGRYSSYQ